MLECQKLMMLDSAVAFEETIKNPKQGVTGMSHVRMQQECHMSECNRYVTTHMNNKLRCKLKINTIKQIREAFKITLDFIIISGETRTSQGIYT